MFPDGDGHSRLVWTTDLLPDTLAALVQARTAVGIQEIRHALEHPDA